MKEPRFSGYDEMVRRGYENDSVNDPGSTPCKDCGADMEDHPYRDEYFETLCDECYQDRLLKDKTEDI